MSEKRHNKLNQKPNNPNPDSHKNKTTHKHSTPDLPVTPRPNTKRTGERSEASFLARALSLHFSIAKPWGDSERYDFILDNGDRLWRIQTKCTESLRAHAYETRATYSIAGKHIPYTRKDTDFIAAHIVPLDLWYIIPVEVCTPAPMLRMYPHRQAKQMRLEKYRNAWFLLKLIESPEDGPITIQASAETERSSAADTSVRELPALILLQVMWINV